MLEWLTKMNREIVGAGGAILYPLTGDVTSEVGNSVITVVGLQSVPVSNTFPTDGSVLTYLSSTNKWTPQADTTGEANTSIQVNGVTVSDDYFVSVNVSLGMSDSPLLVNGA